MFKRVLLFIAAVVVLFYLFILTSHAQQPAAPPARPGLNIPANLEPYKGITTSNGLEPGLFQIKSTGVSTEPNNDSFRMWLRRQNSAMRSLGTVIGRTDISQASIFSIPCGRQCDGSCNFR